MCLSARVLVCCVVLQQGKISREDVAELCVELLEGASPAATLAVNTTFEIKCTLPFSQPWVPPEGGQQPRDWRLTLSAAALQQGVTGKSINGVYTGKGPESAAPAAPATAKTPAPAKVPVSASA